MQKCIIYNIKISKIEKSNKIFFRKKKFFSSLTWKFFEKFRKFIEKFSIISVIYQKIGNFSRNKMQSVPTKNFKPNPIFCIFRLTVGGGLYMPHPFLGYQTAGGPYLPHKLLVLKK